MRAPGFGLEPRHGIPSLARMLPHLLLLASQIRARERTDDDNPQACRPSSLESGVDQAAGEVPAADLWRHLRVNEGQRVVRALVREVRGVALDVQLEPALCGVVRDGDIARWRQPDSGLDGVRRRV